MVRAKRPAGFTLIEAGIVFSLMAGLLALVTMFFVRGQRYAVDTETYAAAQRNSAVVLRKITSDLYTAAEKEMQIPVTEDAIWFLSSRPISAAQPFMELDRDSGKIVWRQWVCYFRDGSTENLVRAQVPLDSPDSELLTSPAPSVSLSYFQTSPTVARQTVGRLVSRFAVSRTTEGVFISLNTHAEAPLTNTSAPERQVEVQISSEVTLIN